MYTLADFNNLSTLQIDQQVVSRYNQYTYTTHMVQTPSRKTHTQRTNNGIARRMSALKTHNLTALKKKRAHKSAARKQTKPAAQKKAQSIAKNLEKENLKCAICLELFVHPFQLPCRHTFCYMCLDSISRSQQLSKCCPLCRGEMGGNHPLKASEVYNKLRSLLCKLESSQRDRYMDRLREVQQSFERRNSYMKDLVILQHIGYKADNFWRIGRVVGMFRENNKQKVQVISLNRRFYFIFDTTSCHLEAVRALTANFSLAQMNLFTQFSSYSLDPGNSDPQDITSPTTIDCSSNPNTQPDRMFLKSLSSSQGKQNSNRSFSKRNMLQL